MPRVWKSKTDRIRKSNEEIRSALEDVSRGSSIRSAAKSFNISYSALQRYVKKSQSMPEGEFKHEPNTTVRKLFTN